MAITDRPQQRAHTLDDAMLERFRGRAGTADERNEYFHEDLEELRGIGYLTAAVPEHHGGWGLDLVELAGEQRRLARYAPATALGMAMHLYWTGGAVEMERAGDTSLTWILQEAVAGKVFAAGHAEAGNDVAVLMSTALAERVDGGYRYTGHKMFGSNGPVWSYLGVHGLDPANEAGPAIVHAFVPRDTDGVTVRETWNTLGMRPTQSHDTVLDGVVVPDRFIGRVTGAGDPSDPFLTAMQAWALGLVSSVYLGIADRAFELAVESAKTKTSVSIPRGAYAYNPMVQHQIAEMYLDLDAAGATLDRLVHDWVTGAEHGELWGAQIMGCKWTVVEAAKRVVDRALDVTGGGGMFKGNELERLYRDVRCGPFHPGNDALVHELIGKAALGIAAEQPRW